MKRTVIALTLLLMATPTFAALAPDYQNLKDLEVMVRYAKEHREVAAGLETINLRSFTISLRNGCQVKFGRQRRIIPPGWVGPAAPLKYKKTICK